MQINGIMQEVLRLPATDRLEIVDLIHQSLDKPDPEINRIWGGEAVRRLADYDAGHGKTYSMDDVISLK